MLRKRPVWRGARLVWGAVFAMALSGSEAARGAIYGGGGGARNDCLLVFDGPVNDPPSRPRRVRCSDGDPSCDTDGVVNGVCVFAIGVCANSTFDLARCVPDRVSEITVDHAQDNGDPKFDPDFQALQTRIDTQILEDPTALDRCTTPTNITVSVSGPAPGNVCRPGKKRLRIVSLFIGAPANRRDVDKLALTCDPPLPCSPQALFAGTFDRIERQIFRPSCALSGCHDSQSQAGGMLLEAAGAYSNLVDVIPSNGTAAGLGWRRVDAMNASVETSFLYRKLTGDLPAPGLGARMPLNRAKLDRYLIDIVRLWIEAGAPDTGWVPGTN